jgi:Carbohydrate-binding module 48 (Isoamylase N-terminal domain)
MTVTTRPGAAAPLGATVTDDGVNFSLYSSAADAVELLLFDAADVPASALTIALDPVTNRTDNYWHVHVAGVGTGQLYGYRVSGPHRPDDGLRFDHSKVLLDPYARAVIDDSYDRPSFAQRGVANDATAMKGVVVDPLACDWDGDEPLRRPFSRGPIYEMHVRRFTANPSSGVAAERCGTYAGVVEKISYTNSTASRPPTGCPTTGATNRWRSSPHIAGTAPTAGRPAPSTSSATDQGVPLRRDRDGPRRRVQPHRRPADDLSGQRSGGLRQSCHRDLSANPDRTVVRCRRGDLHP